MRTLVVGSGGFAGRWLVAELAARGHEVIGTRSPGEGAETRGRGGTGSCGAEAATQLPCDVRDVASVREAVAVAAPDSVVLLAGISFAPRANRDPAEAYAVHALGVIHVVTEAARQRPGVRVLVVTTGEVYAGLPPAEMPALESAPLLPVSLYAATKAAGDLACIALARGYDGVLVRARPFNHTGPGQRAEFVCPDFARQVAAIARGRRAPRMEVGNLDVQRDFSDVRDIVRGYADALERGRHGEVYNLCSGRPAAIREVLETLASLAGATPEVVVDPRRVRPDEVKVLYGSAEKARRELGWVPARSLRETLEDLLAWAGDP